MTSDRRNPHDALFKYVLGRPEHAASELRSVLSPALVERLDLERLTPVPGSFVDEELRWRHCDLLFSTKDRGRDVLVYVLMEHQSSPDSTMAWRMLRYITRIWDNFKAKNPKATLVPVVVPVVVYHGREPWPYSCELSDLLDVDAALAADPVLASVLPRFAFLLDDVSRLEDDALRARPLTAPTRLTFVVLARAAGHQHVGDLLRPWITDLRAMFDGPDGRGILSALFTYINAVGQGPIEDLRPILEQVGPEAEEVYVTIAEQLRAEGEARGVAKGRVEGMAGMLLKQLTARFGEVPGATVEVVRSASVEQLEGWMVRVLTAPTMDDVLS